MTYPQIKRRIEVITNRVEREELIQTRDNIEYNRLAFWGEGKDISPVYESIRNALNTNKLKRKQRLGIELTGKKVEKKNKSLTHDQLNQMFEESKKK